MRLTEGSNSSYNFSNNNNNYFMERNNFISSLVLGNLILREYQEVPIRPLRHSSKTVRIIKLRREKLFTQAMRITIWPREADPVQGISSYLTMEKHLNNNSNPYKEVFSLYPLTQVLKCSIPNVLKPPTR